MKYRFALPFFFFCQSLAYAAPSENQHIYQWTDEAGQIHFSNSPQNSESTPTNLPSITHENIDERIKDLKAKTAASCEKHGGIDCSAGADSDGSVICLDGFRGALVPFQFQCLEARIRAEFLVTIDGEPLSYVPHSSNLAKKLSGKTLHGFQLTLRNLSGIEAYGIDVDFFVGHKKLVKAKGPEKIGAYGNADYTLLFSELSQTPNMSDLERSEYKVKCTNCSTVLKGQSQ